MKTILITGGSRGIGKATVNKFLNMGWSVITTSTTGKLDYSNENLVCHKFDLSSLLSLKNLLKELTNNNVKLDCLINNAWGSVARGNEDLIDTELLTKVFITNVVGTINLTQKILTMLKNGSVIVSISSEYGSLTEDWGFVVPTYRIAKTSINMFTRNFYKSKVILEKQIKVYSFDPGWVKTDMGGPEAPRKPEEPAEELYNLINSDLPSGEFYRGLAKRDW